MRGLHLSVLLSGLAVVSSARANTFVLSYENRPSADPAEGFEADCLGATESADCASRAAALEAELVELLGELEGLSDSETVGLFTSAVGIDTPGVQAVGLRYFARRGTVPTGLWANVKAFFFGPDPTVGQPSAELLGMSSESLDQQLSELYLEQRSSNDYGNTPPDETGAEDPWAQATFNDLTLDAVEAFPEEQRFTPASRLLMIDRFLPDYQSSMLTIPVSGFVTDAPRADVEAHFTKLLKKPPYPPVASSEAQLETLSAELTSLTPRLTSGDKQALERYQAIVQETTRIQEGLTVGSLLNLDDEQTAGHVFWLDGPAESAYMGMRARAVVVGTDPLLGKTAIRYVGGTSKSVSLADGGVSNPDPNNPPGNSTDGGVVVPDEETPGKKSGGGCSLAPRPSTSAGLSMLWAVAVLLTRRARRTRAAH